MVLNVLPPSHLFIEHDQVFEHMPDLLSSDLTWAFLLLPHGFGANRGELVHISKDNDNRQTTEHCS
jgi:hypothetical protein